MFSTLFVSPTASLKYCRVHQRAWVESLDRWVAFREPVLYGSPVTEAMCDTCTAAPLPATPCRIREATVLQDSWRPTPCVDTCSLRCSARR